MSTKVLIVGGGFAGCNAAHMLSMKKPNYKIDVIETSKDSEGMRELVDNMTNEESIITIKYYSLI